MNDAVGNIITRTEGATTRVYAYNDADHVHAVTDIGSWSFIYDANGNMISRVDGTDSYSQTFDVENRLILVTDTQASETTQFIYDGDGNRVVTIWPDSTKTEFPATSAGLRVGLHYEVEGSTTRTYYFLAGQRIALRKEAGQSDEVYWFHTDHLGSTSLLTNEGGSVASNTTARYKPFGDYRTTPTADHTDHGLTGHKHQDEVGMIFMRARFYLHFEVRKSSNVDLSQSNPFGGKVWWPKTAADLYRNYVNLGPVFGYHQTYEQWFDSSK